MPDKYYIYSTLASDNAYTNYENGGADLPVALPAVLIHGGAGVANDRFVTPRGVVTEVTGEQLDYLRRNPVFLMHEKNGYILVDSNRADPDQVAADMTGRDVSAPLVPQDAAAPAESTMVVGGDIVEQAARKGKK